MCLACIIHKVRGSTLQNDVLYTAYIRTSGLMYEAISRGTNQEGLDFHEKSIKVTEATKDNMKRLQPNMKLENVKTLLQKRILNQLHTVWLNTCSIRKPF